MRKLFLLTIVFVFIILGIIALYNTITTFSKQLQVKPLIPEKINDSLALGRLSAAIRIPLVKNPIDSLFKEAVKTFPIFLKDTFPNIHNDPSVNIISFGSNSMLYRLKGRDSRLKPILLLAEIDVNDPDLNKLPQWSYNPFLGKINDGYIWGAGVMGSKAAALAILEALEATVQEGKIPQRTLYLALVNNIDKNNHEILAKLLEKEGLDFEFVLNTESHINEGSCLGIKRPIAALATSEKFELKLKMKGFPPDFLKKKIENLTQKRRGIKTKGKAASELLSTIIPELNFTNKFLFCNPFFFSSIIESRLKNDALLSKMFEIDMNILKMDENETEINWLLPPDTDLNEFKKFVNTEFNGIDLSWEEDKNKRNISQNQGYAYEAMQTCIRQTLGDVIVIPAIKVKPGNIAFYKNLSKSLFDFRPWGFNQSEIERFNSGIDHRLAVKQYLRGIHYYRTLFRNTLF